MTKNSNKIKELFQELERLQHNDKVDYVTFEDWENGLRCPSFYLSDDVYYELHYDGVLRYWYRHMNDEGLEADIKTTIEDLKKIEKESFVVIEVAINSLVLSPLLTKEQNTKMFKDWINEVYENVEKEEIWAESTGIYRDPSKLVIIELEDPKNQN